MMDIVEILKKDWKKDRNYGQKFKGETQIKSGFHILQKRGKRAVEVEKDTSQTPKLRLWFERFSRSSSFYYVTPSSLWDEGYCLHKTKIDPKKRRGPKMKFCLSLKTGI